MYSFLLRVFPVVFVCFWFKPTKHGQYDRLALQKKIIHLVWICHLFSDCIVHFVSNGKNGLCGTTIAFSLEWPQSGSGLQLTRHSCQRLFSNTTVLSSRNLHPCRQCHSSPSILSHHVMCDLVFLIFQISIQSDRIV